ncbi:MAG: hypothetical protein M3619_04425 [Myxococcota bacterium]|nr:hypothetical protein [Myxococcota bacterium]
MIESILLGVNGASPLGFMASLGLLRLARGRDEMARLRFLADGTSRAVIHTSAPLPLAKLVADDASTSTGTQPWSLQYEKTEKKGVKTVADLKAPPEAFAAFLRASVKAWLAGSEEATAYAAAFGTSVAKDGKGNTKPTAFHFTAANQQFLGTLELVRASVTDEWAHRSLFEGHAARSGQNLRWDPAAERNWALRANNPIDEGTMVDAPLEWLAFRGLPLFPTIPVGARVLTSCVSGRGDEMRVAWPLWSPPASINTIRSLMQVAGNMRPRDCRARGIFATYASAIRRTSQGFGSFGPASVMG